MSNELDAKTTLLGAALHYNPELKTEVEDWVQNIVADAIARELKAYSTSSYEFERIHINNFASFQRLVREAMRQDFEFLRNSGR
jgi:hypothetical protein